MAKIMNTSLFLVILQISLIAVGTLSLETHDDSKVYIVYMGSVSEENSLASQYHLSVLQQVLHGRLSKHSTAEEFLLKSYKKSFNGFAARLTEKQSENIKSIKGVVSVFPSRTLELQTTRSWDFLGLIESVAPRNKSAESDVIIGVLDTGAWPESPSFNDDGLGPPPKKWRGVCQGGKNFICNNKLIGARTAYDSARDNVGHGTHTASTAAGRIVDHASFYGLAEGSARGAVPSARIAVYKVCDDQEGCSESEILAAFDEAIADGVDLISISLGGQTAAHLYNDGIAIGSFHAVQKGILTVQSAGNSGNSSGLVASVAPWLFSVAAGSTDRHIIDKAVLGNGKTLLGNSINSFALKGDLFPLVYGLQASSQCEESRATACSAFCLDKKLVEGKIVVCDDLSDNGIVEGSKFGALGVFSRSSFDDVSMITPAAGIKLNPNEFQAVLSYYNSTKAPKANILKSESFNDTSAPIVVSFSSRGPNLIASDILKPDITTPGVEILAAYSPAAPATSNRNQDNNTRRVDYSILSGTSMSCPHVAGAAAYLKTFHPDWSPSAIKSALMTTINPKTRPMNASKNPDAEFAYGSGHIDPVKAINPGLVYETSQDDYLTFLCKLNYTREQVIMISDNKTFSCPKKSNEGFSPNDVNYPSFSALVNTGNSYNVKFSRTVTNVGVANSTYKAKVESATSIKITVNPNSLSFTSLNERKSFDVVVVGKALSAGSQVSASLVWSDGIHAVRSPIIVHTQDTFDS